MFKIKTPHRNNSSHLLRFTGYFAYACLLVGILLQSKLTWPSFSTIGALVVTPVITVAVGLPITIVIRWCFSLVQTGRLLQWLSFWVGAYIAVRVSTSLFPDAVWHYSAGFTSLLITIVAFASAIWLNEVPWKGRTWFPARKKRSHHAPPSKGSIAVTRFCLEIKAEWLGILGDHLRSQTAWQDLVDFEKQHLPEGSAARSHALTELAQTYLGGDVHQLSLAKTMLTTAYRNLVTDLGEHHFRVGCSLQLLGRIEQQLGNLDGACELHQAAEDNFQQNCTLSYSRANNLKELSNCYKATGNSVAAASCDVDAEELYRMLRLRPRYGMVPH